MSTPQHQSPLINIGAYSVYLMMVSVMCWPTFSHLATVWISGADYHQAAFALPLAGLLIWLRRADAPRIKPTAGSIKLAILIGLPANFLLIVSRIFDVDVLGHLGFALVLIAGFIACFGVAFSRHHKAALMFSLFLVPLGDALLYPMQSLTALSVETIFKSTGMTIERDALLLTTQSGRFLVAEACAGMRMMITSMMIGGFYAILTLKRNDHIALVVMCAGAVGIGINIFRAWLMVFLATLSDMKIATGYDHYLFGMMIYFMTFAVIIILVRKLAAQLNSH